jgi:lipoate-protein ligase A
MLQTMRWHFLVTAPADGASNMALDEALMRRAVRDGDAVFRIYGWASPTLSLGRNQRARGCYDEAAARSLDVRFVRRPTGGRALLHHREVTYSATLPVSDATTASNAYVFINEMLLAGLRMLGVRAGMATATHAMPPGLRPCFDVPAEHEIVVGPRKLVGSAQWRHRGALLQHGSILIRDDQALIGRLMREPQGDTPRAATLAEALGREPAFDEVAGHMRQALAEATGGAPQAFTVPPDLERESARLRASYASDEWTWRR